MNRREFIRYSCCGAALLGVSGFSYSWLRLGEESAMRKKYMVSPIGYLTEKESMILYLASLAPSGHNTQPWIIDVRDKKEWYIGFDQARQLSVVDPDNRELMLSIGAFIENLITASSMQGEEAKLDVLAKHNFGAVIAKIRFTGKKISYGIDLPIAARRTIRNGFLPLLLRESDLADLTAVDPDAIFYYPLNSNQGKRLSEISLSANRDQVARDGVQAELAEWIRWNDQSAAAHENGLTPESMEIQGISRWYVKYFFGKEDVMSETFREESVKLAQSQVQQGAGWLLISSKGTAPYDLIQAGRSLESAWLRACARSIAFHPMTQMLEEVKWQKVLTAEFGEIGTIQFVVRVGYIENYPAPVSLRMPLEKITLL